MPDRPINEGDLASFRVMAAQAASMALAQHIEAHPVREKAEIPAPLKWAAGIVAALFTAGIAGMALWLVTSVSEMQNTLARMDERMTLQANSQDGRFEDFDRRVTRLEDYHRSGDSK